MSCLRLRLLLLLRRRRRRRRAPRVARSPAANTPLEDDDLLGEILLRLPPQPSSLPRAGLVCKRWRSLASDPSFCRRFRLHHRRKPPLLGFFKKGDLSSFMPTLEAPNRVPPRRFSLQPGDGDGDRFMSLGCRHGLVLILNITLDQMLVWDPVTGDQHRLAIPPTIATYAEKVTINGAVLRVGEAHFQVILTLGGNDDKQHERVLARVYSSETGLWGDLISTRLPSVVPRSGFPTMVFTGKPAVLAGGSIYWMLVGNFAGILEFDLEKQSLGVIRVPLHMLEEGNYLFWIMRAEGGGLGLLFQTGPSFQLWKRNTDCHGVHSWELGRTIELDKLLSLKPRQVDSAAILGLAEENNVVYMWACGKVFKIHPESLQFKMLYETSYLSHYHPFECVYTTENGIGGVHDAADLLHHT